MSFVRVQRSSEVLCAYRWGPYDNKTKFSFLTTTNTDTTTYIGEDYLPYPDQSVDLPEEDVSLEVTFCKVIYPADGTSFLTLISNGEPFPDVYVNVFELTDTDVNNLFAGWVSRGVANPAGKSSTIMVEIGSPEIMLQNRRLGRHGDFQCDQTFMGNGCLVVSAIDKVGQVTVTNSILTNPGQVLVDDASANVFTRADTHWNAGYFEDDEGLRIGIRSWTGAANPNSFVLYDKPPARWLNKTVRVVAGCEKTLTKCQFWQNEGRFSGLMVDSPAYNPAWEVP